MYPRETILLCQNHKNGVYREPQETGNGLQAKEGAFAPTLLELEQPEQFQFYDLFDVSEFTFSPEKKTGHLKMELSMLQKYRKLSLSAQLLDTEKEVVLKEIPIKCAADESRLTVEQDFALDEEILPENLGVLVHGAWEADGLEENKMKILRKADLQAKDYIYKHTHPASQETTCIIGSIEGLDPYIPVTWEKGESGHIVIALIRKPEDLKDVDYLCGAGRVPQKANRPVLCVPGAGELDFSAGCQPVSDSRHLNTAECRLYKKSGGCAVIASTAAYEIEGKSDSDGAIKLTRTGNGYRYQFTAWNNGKNPISYDDADQWRKTEFDYELKLTVYSTTQESTGKRWHRHTLRVASFEKADYTIPSLQIMYGCVAADTNIRMADGSEKEIRFVKIGDTVLGRDGIEMKVENVWSGPEQEPMRDTVGNSGASDVDRSRKRQLRMETRRRLSSGRICISGRKGRVPHPRDQRKRRVGACL